MEKTMLLTQVQEIFREVLDNDEVELANETTADDIDEWDSLSHIQLVVAIEKNYNIKFSSREILSWSNVGDMIDSIIKKM